MHSAPTETFRFLPQASGPKNAIALIYDLEGFSRFFNQPDVQEYVPIFLNHISEAIGAVFQGGPTYWCPEGAHVGGLPLPVHEKYLGDGALYIFTPESGSPHFTEIFLIELCNRLWNLMNNYDVILRKCADQVPVFELPPRIRFGLARGTIHELRHSHSDRREYIGFCINLASRLQKYCRQLGFIASARINLPENILDSHGYIKVVATRIAGFSKELVIVDRDEFQALDPTIRDDLFETLPGGQ